MRDDKTNEREINNPFDEYAIHRGAMTYNEKGIYNLLINSGKSVEIHFASGNSIKGTVLAIISPIAILVEPYVASAFLNREDNKNRQLVYTTNVEWIDFIDPVAK